jgi:hypothetical protein
MRPANEASDVDEFNRGGNEPIMRDEDGKSREARILNWSDTDVAVGGREGIRGDLRIPMGQGIEEGRLPDVRKPSHPEFGAHRLHVANKSSLVTKWLGGEVAKDILSHFVIQPLS